ncbi:MAG TPA: OmpA family protein [Acetobacteraceae bacterium]|jgi:OmpA-OmpF porin, OOP family|nr:OmpA family protein [Acetobacteraceae bacterium]
MRLTKSILAGAVLAWAVATPVLAQSNPSADDIIKSLKPTGVIGSGTRGIRPTSAATAPASATPRPAGATEHAGTAEHAASPAVPVVTKAPSANLEVKFATNSADLTPAARAALDQLGKALSSSDLAQYHFRIEGHTDTVGSPEVNRSLSARRADAVVDYLASVYHIDRSRLQAIGMGEDDLAVPTGQQVPEPRNRRVQVINLDA